MEIKERLSEYIDGQLDAETDARVRKHLASCKVCAAELASMKALVHELGDLDPVEVPADFMDRLHRRIEEPPGFSKFLRALFVPFKIKVPLEFAGAAAAAVLVFIVLNVQQPNDAVRHRPMAPALEEPAREVAPTAPAPRRFDPAKLAQKTSPAETRAPAPIKAQESLLAVENPKEEEAPEKASPIELVLVIPKDLPRQRDAAPSVDSMSADTPSVEGKARKGPRIAGRSRPKAPGALGGTGLSRKDEELPSSPPLKKIRDLVTFNHGRVLAVEYEEDTQTPRSVLVDIPVLRLSTFFNGLAELGYLKTSPLISDEKPRERIQMNLRFLHPGEFPHSP